MIQINPKKLTPTPQIHGFVEAYVLDYHNVSSLPTNDPYYRFDTKRTELGELLYRIKYKQNHKEKDQFLALCKLVEITK